MFNDSAKMMAANITQSLLGVLTLAVLARIFTLSDMGVYLLILSLYLSGRFSSLPGMNSAIHRGVVKGNEEVIIPAMIRSLLCSLGAGVAAVIAGYILRSYGDLETTGEAIFLAGLMLPLGSLEKFDHVLKARKKFTQSAGLLASGAMLKAILVTIVAFYSNSVELTILAYALSIVIKCIVGWILVFVASGHRGTELSTSALLRQGWEQTGFQFLNPIMSQLDKVILGTMDPVMLAVYHIGAQIPNVVKGNIKALISVQLVHLSGGSKKGNIEALRQNGRKIILLGFIITIFLASASPIIVPLLFGEEYKDAIYIAIAISTTIGIKTLAIFYWSIDLYQDNGRKYGINAIASKIFYVGCLFMLTYFFGMWGVVGAVVLLDLYQFISGLFYFKRLLSKEVDVNMAPITSAKF